MANYGFKIGMSMDKVAQILNKTNATKETKKMISLFWEKDIDGKITDDVELTLLNTWASGSTKVKQPNYSESRCKQNGNTVIKKGGKINTREFCLGFMTRGTVSELKDTDGDGFADVYSSWSVSGLASRDSFEYKLNK